MGVVKPARSVRWALGHRSTTLLAAVMVALLAVPLQACARSNRKKPTNSAAVSVRLSSPDQSDLLNGAPLRIELRARTSGRFRVVLSALAADGARQRMGLARLGPIGLARRATKTLSIHLDPVAQQILSSCEYRRLEVSVSPLGRTRSTVVRATQALHAQPPRCGRFFSPTTVWNAALAPEAPLDPDSTAIAAELARQVEQGFSSGKPPWINTTAYSAPIYTVRRDQPTLRVKLDYPNAPDLQQAWDSVPMPAEARPADGTDRHMVVWQPSTDTMWEFWVADKQADGWHAAWGGRMLNVSSGPGYFTAPSNWGATATSLPLVGGLITLAELHRGRIDHALAIAVPAVRAGAFAWPAQRTDGRATSQYSIPEGARFRLDASLNLDALNLPPIVRMIAEAAQRYGLIVRDEGGSVAFFGEDPTPTGSDPYPALLGNSSPGELLRRFPWDRLELLRMQLSSAPGG